MTPSEDFVPSIDAPTVSWVRRERVRWIWEGRIPGGKLSVADGDPGLGKSTVLLDIGARLSTASPMPDGARRNYPVDAIYLSAEDSIADTIRPRLEASGADLNRVHVFKAVKDKGKESFRPPELPGDLNLLEAFVREKDAAMVVVDPLMAFLGGQYDAHRDQDVRRALYSFSEMAARTGAAIVVVRHLNKGTQGNALYRGGGSIGIIGAARAGMIVAKDPEDEGRRILAWAKSNLAPEPQALAYRLVHDERFDVARVIWEGPVDYKADALVGVPPERNAPKLSAAEVLLQDMLGAGPRLRREIEVAAKDQGISWRTVDTAKAALGIVSRQFPEAGKQGPGPSYWALPEWAAREWSASPKDMDFADHSPVGESAGQVPNSGAGENGMQAPNVAGEPFDAIAYIRSALSAEEVAPPSSRTASEPKPSTGKT